MLLIPKPNTTPPEFRAVEDLRERNKNTRKQASPLPDMDGMPRRTGGTAQRRFCTTLDMTGACEQILMVPESALRTTVTTPDVNMVLMNHSFSAYVSSFMDIYLDDIVIYSDMLGEHVKHVEAVLDSLKREKLYLSRANLAKLCFIEPISKILGRMVDNDGICQCMDPDKVDCVLNWRVPTNWDLVQGFNGSVGYLADDIPNVHVPMGI